MLEKLINNNIESNKDIFNLNSYQLYKLSKNDDKKLNIVIEQYRREYNLSIVDVYVNMAILHKGAKK
jgi:hypothetical protein